ncbi:MAG TPA: hypothetical protein G4O02_16335 [Caldilineae bacterium]|jgi:hypothetical protein|nr:hypothetical protein [Caldilineae bacterium]
MFDYRDLKVLSTAPALQVQGMGRLSDLLDDLVVYRRLEPMDPRLPSLQDAWRDMGLADSSIPRKLEQPYARVVTWLLQRARELDAPGQKIRQVIYLGDTATSDSIAFHNVLQVTGWSGWAFIASEQADAPPTIEHRDDGITLTNRWGAIAHWLCWLTEEQGVRIDASTAVIVDIDKTALGGRGRNSTPIDQARMEGVEQIVAQVLGERFDHDLFQRAYQELNQSRYHPFTADNQDYLAYTCLIIGAGLCSLEELIEDISTGRMADFEQFIRWVDARLCRADDLGLIDIHRTVYAHLRAGDPTPFKAFRRQEYLATVRRMGHLPNDVPIERRLQEEICLTGEVLAVVKWLKERDVIMLALSDKPDEASVPTPEQETEGYLPLHRVPTHIVGHPIEEWLPR